MIFVRLFFAHLKKIRTTSHCQTVKPLYFIYLLLFTYILLKPFLTMFKKIYYKNKKKNLNFKTKKISIDVYI